MTYTPVSTLLLVRFKRDEMTRTIEIYTEFQPYF